MPARLTLRELNRTGLARQLLLDRSPRDPLAALEHLFGVQSQDLPAPFIGLWSRLAGFQRADLLRAIASGDAVKATLMRATLHLVTRRDFDFLRPLVQPALSRFFQSTFGRRMGGVDPDAVAARARSLLRERPRSFAEIRLLLAEHLPQAEPVALAYAARMLLPLVVQPSGARWGFAGSAKLTLREAPAGSTSPEAGLPELVRRYLAAFGPASVRDLQTWSGLTRLRSTVEALRPELRSCQDDRGAELFDLPGAAIDDGETPAPPRFLPTWDNLLMGHADRRRFVREEDDKRVFGTPVRGAPLFLVDGYVAGVWRSARKGRSATLDILPFRPLPTRTKEDLAAEGEALLNFLEPDAEATEVRIEG